MGGKERKKSTKMMSALILWVLHTVIDFTFGAWIEGADEAPLTTGEAETFGRAPPTEGVADEAGEADEAAGGTIKDEELEDKEVADEVLKGSPADPKGEIPGNPAGFPNPASNEFGPPILEWSLPWKKMKKLMTQWSIQVIFKMHQMTVICAVSRETMHIFYGKCEYWRARAQPSVKIIGLQAGFKNWSFQENATVLKGKTN